MATILSFSMRDITDMVCFSYPTVTLGCFSREMVFPIPVSYLHQAISDRQPEERVPVEDAPLPQPPQLPHSVGAVHFGRVGQDGEDVGERLGPGVVGGEEHQDGAQRGLDPAIKAKGGLKITQNPSITFFRFRSWVFLPYFD